MGVIDIAGRKVGPGLPCLVIAELSGNHLGSLDWAKALVYAAKKAGADACKVQVFDADAMTLDSDAEPFRLTWGGKPYTLHQLYRETAMPLDWHAGLKALCDSLGVIYFGSVFDQTGIDLMVRLGVPVLKVASFELTDLPLIRACARTGKPLILSTGMATQQDTSEALAAWYSAGGRELAILKCTSAYPAGAGDANLRTLGKWVADWVDSPDLDYSIVYGLSDHSRSNAVVSAAVALGASIVERHLTLDRSAGGPDAAFSDEPAEFAAMVRAIRETEAALGEVHYGPTEAERPMLRYRRSLWAVRDIAAGEALTPENVRCLRPADGLPPAEWDRVIGRRAKRAIPRGTPLAWELLE